MRSNRYEFGWIRVQRYSTWLICVICG